MPQRKFVNQKALVDYAERNGLVYLWAGPERRTSPMPTFTKRQSSLDGDLGVVRDKKTRHAANRCKLTEHCIARSVTDTAWAWASPDPSLAAAVGAAGLEP